ncbi:unnamed protein product [Coffea canephora]|uniref:Proteinase inhibitor n=1 Tax=Coffea canephora TaxID=49390 RepID=A0A068TTD7_COFCA|nr:unnamed protein product [Coffea canephora]
MSECPAGKNSWPELVGEDGDKAAAKIEQENQRVKKAIVVDESAIVTTDFRCARVWVFVNKEGKVSVVPKIG